MKDDVRSRYSTARKQLRSVSQFLVDRGEPLHLMQEMYYNIMALRSELTTIMDILARGDKFEERAYTEQMITRLNDTIRVLCTGAEIMVDPFGLVIDLRKIRSDGKESKA